MAPSSVTHQRRDASKRNNAYPESRLRLGRQRFRSSAGKLVGKTTSNISDASTDCPAQQESTSSSSGIPRRRSPRRDSPNTRSGEQSYFLDGSENLDLCSDSYLCEGSSSSCTLIAARRPSDAHVFDATAPPDASGNVRRLSWSSRLSEATIFPDEQRAQVDRLLSDAIEANEDQACDEEFSFGARCGRIDSLYSENTCTKVDHALKYTEELLAKCRALSCCDTPVHPREHTESVSLGIEENSQCLPTDIVQDGSNDVRSEEQVISSFIKYIEELTFDPEVLSLITHSGEIVKILKELSVVGKKIEVTRLYELLQSCGPAVIGEMQPSNNTSVDNHAVSSSPGRPHFYNIALDSRTKSSSSSVVASTATSPALLRAPAHAQKVVHRSFNESVSSAYVTKSGLGSPGNGSPLPSKASHGHSDVFSSRNACAPRGQASIWNSRGSCRSPRASLDASGSAPAIRSPRMYSSCRVQVEVQPPSVPSLPPSQRQASPTRAEFSRGCEGIMNRRAASPEHESNAMPSRHCPQSIASHILQTAFGACATSGSPRRSTTASPVRLHSTSASPARQRVMSPSLRTRAPISIAMQPPVAAPSVVSPPANQAISKDGSCRPVALLSSLQPDRSQTQFIWEPVSVTTSYRLRKMN